jgi:hypothetical protein
MSQRPLQIVYLAGMGRNGGTLLDRLLGQCSGAISLGELKFVWLKGIVRNEPCNCGAAFRDCGFWREVFERAFGGMARVDGREMVELHRSVDSTRWLPLLLAPQRPAAYRERLARYVEATAALHRAVAETSGAEVLVNSSKFAGYGHVLTRMPGFEVSVIHLVRDPRASAWSWSGAARVRAAGAASAGAALPRAGAATATLPRAGAATATLPRAGAANHALQWLYRNAAAETLARRARRYRLLRYEDFAASPRWMVEDLNEWLGRGDATTPFTSETSAVLAAGHTQSGNPGRFTTGPVEVRLDERWRSELPAVDAAVTRLIGWPGMRRWGY